MSSFFLGKHRATGTRWLRIFLWTNSVKHVHVSSNLLVPSPCQKPTWEFRVPSYWHKTGIDYWKTQAGVVPGISCHAHSIAWVFCICGPRCSLEFLLLLFFPIVMDPKRKRVRSWLWSSKQGFDTQHRNFRLEQKGILSYERLYLLSFKRPKFRAK